MAHEVKIPAAGESINSASVGQWHKASGDAVKKGDLLATIETDKVSTELEAEVAGTLKIVVEEGEEVAIGTVIAEIAPAKAKAKAAPKKMAAAPKKKAVASAKSAAKPKAKKARATAPDGAVVEIKVPAAGESITSASIAQWHKREGEMVAKGDSLVTLETDKVSAELEASESGLLSILAAESAEVSIGAVIGTITVGAAPQEAAAPATPPPAEEPAPVPEATPAPPAAEADAKPVAPQPEQLKPDLTVVSSPSTREALPAAGTTDSDGRTTRRRMSPLRRKIATQLVNAQQTAAILTTFNEVDMSAVMKLRKAVQEDFVKKYGVKLGFMSFFVKAVVQALKDVPSVNARVDGEEFVQNHFFDIGIAVGTEKGLIVPVVREADQKGFARIEQDIIDYANRARDGKIQLEDLRGGGFTISNGGIYGSLLSTPILNPPQSGILGMHTIQPRPVAVEGKVVIRPMMYLALSYDHRIVDGKEAVTFLIGIKESLENPTRLLLEL